MTTKTATPSTDTTLIMKRTFAVPKARVFHAWTTPAMLTKWFAASEAFEPDVAEVDLRVGGKYRMGMKHREKGNVHIATGVYREIVPDERLVFTWEWEGEGMDGETLITITLREAAGGTEMILKHEFFPTKESRDQHEEGWTGCFGNLGNAVSR